MGFRISVKTRNGTEEVIMSGNDDGTVEFVKELTVKVADTDQTKITYAPYKYFMNIDSAIDRIFRMRCNNRDADTLQELLKNVKEERELLQKEFSGQFPATRRAAPVVEAAPTPRRRRNES
jgi:hypothetical protein